MLPDNSPLSGSDKQARVVLKFGGTSMGSFSAMQRCAEIALNYAALPHHAQVPLSFQDSQNSQVPRPTQPGSDKLGKVTVPAELTAVLQGRQKMAIVVSAVAGVTNWLQSIFCEASDTSKTLLQRRSKMQEELQNLRHKHQKIVEECARQFGLQTAVLESFYHSKLERLFQALEQLLQNQLQASAEIGTEAAKEAEQELAFCRTQAECLAFGEKLSSCIFCFVLQQNIASRAVQYQLDNCVEPCTLSGEALIISDSNYLKARLNFERSQVQIENQLDERWRQNRLSVVAGFTAADAEGQTTLLGRGGSDFSAAILAAALKLPTLDIWTDVAGIYSCDPRLVPQARLWDKLDSALVSEMAYSGAKVIHPKSISIALQAQVAVIVRSTFAAKEKGTLIVPPDPTVPDIQVEHPKAEKAKLAGLVLSHDSLLLHMENPNMLEGEGYIAQIAGAAHQQEIPIDICATSETSFSFSIHHADCNSQLLDDLRQIGEIRQIRHLHKLCCVGWRIGCDIQFIAELLSQCRALGIELETLSIGASHTNVTILFRFPQTQLSKTATEGSEDSSIKAVTGATEDNGLQGAERATATQLLRHLHRHFLES